MFLTHRRFLAAAILMMPLFVFGQIIAVDDYAHTTVNATTPVAIKVLSNDNPANSVLKLDKLALVNHGQASIVGSEIRFTPEKDFKGAASVNYTITDSLGNYACGLVTIHVSEPVLPQTQTVKLFTRPGEKIIFTLPRGFDAPAIGNAQGDVVNGFGAGSGVFGFVPYLTFSGDEPIRLSFQKNDNGLTKYFEVELNVLGSPISKFLKDDYVYLPVGTPSKTIDVFANDNTNLPVQSYTVTNVSNPNCQAIPAFGNKVLLTANANFKGNFNFDYNVTFIDGTKESATVHTIFSNYQPINQTFEITAYQGVPYELKYNVPISSNNRIFLIRNNGISNAGGSVSLNGKKEIVYTPPSVGTSDYFEVEYCVSSSTGQSCNNTIKINVNLKPATAQICSTDCVFPGDANRDGVVDMWDLLTVGSRIGQYGATRANADVSWTPTDGANWGQTLETGVDIKNADLNGDGIISALDTTVRSANYGKINSIIAEKTPESSKIELQVLTSSNAAAQGDMMEITVLVGSAGLPCVDAHGLSFSVGYDADLVEENSLTVNFLPTSWLTRANAFIAMSKFVNRGRIEAGIARSQNRGVSGQGEVVKVRAIVIEDVTGFNIGNTPVLRFRINDVYMMDKKGRMIQIAGKEIAIPIKIAKKDAPMQDSDLLMFPNPSSDFMSFYLNGVNKIESLRVVDMMGKEVSRLNNIKGKEATVYFDNMTSGMYMAEVVTEKGVILKKMQVVK